LFANFEHSKISQYFIFVLKIKDKKRTLQTEIRNSRKNMGIVFQLALVKKIADYRDNTVFFLHA